jgi:hypothetical protein
MGERLGGFLRASRFERAPLASPSGSLGNDRDPRVVFRGTVSV